MFLFFILNNCPAPSNQLQKICQNEVNITFQGVLCAVYFYMVSWETSIYCAHNLGRNSVKCATLTPKRRAGVQFEVDGEEKGLLESIPEEGWG